MHSYVFISAEDKSKEILVLFEDKILCSDFTARAAGYGSFVKHFFKIIDKTGHYRRICVNTIVVAITITVTLIE